MSHTECKTESELGGFITGNVKLCLGAEITTPIAFTKQEFFNKFNIPYINSTLQTNDKGVKQFTQLPPKDWNKKTIEELRRFRDENNSTQHNIHMIRLDTTDFVVIDNDICVDTYPEKHQEINDLMLSKYDGGFITKSFSGKSHIWVKKHQLDSQKQKIGWKVYDEGKVDLIYTTLFEPMTNLDKCMKPDFCGIFTDYVKDTDIDVTLNVNEKIKDSSLDNQQIEMLEMIDIQYWTDYQPWVELILAIHKITNDYNICNTYSKKGSTYDDSDKVRNKIDSFKHNKFDGGTINHYAKLSDPTKYNIIIAKYFKIDEDIEDISDLDLGQKVIDLLADNILCDEDGYIYLYDEKSKFWKCDDAKHLPYTQLKIIQMLDPICKKKLEKWKGKREKDLPEDEQNEKKKWVSIRKKVGSRSGSENISNRIKLILTEQKQDYKFDMVRPEYFCFKNITFDLNKRKPAQIVKEDRITLFANHDYIKPTPKVKKEFDELLKTILPDEDNRNCYLSVLRKGLYGELNEYFTILSGHGRNGKGFLNSLLNFLLTDVFYYQADATLLTEKSKGGSNPMVASMNKKRFTICSEPANDEKLQVDKVKNLTGNPILNARMNFSNNNKTMNTNCLFCESNDMPEFNESPTNAMYERFIKITFPNQFTKKKEMIDNVTFFEAKEIKNIPTYKKYCFAFFDMIMNCQFNDIYIPSSVQLITNKLIRDNDDIYNFIINTYTIMDDITDEYRQELIDKQTIPTITLKDIIKEYRDRINRKVKVGILKDKIMNNRELNRLGILSNSNPNTTKKSANNTPCLIWIKAKNLDLDL